MTVKRPIYLDYNATAPVLPEAAQMAAAVWSQPLNPSSVHSYGRAGRKLLDDARVSVAQALGAEGAQVIFTASGTEANNLALNGLLKDADNIAVAATEHVSVLKPAEKNGAVFIPVNAAGIVEAKTLAHLLAGMRGKTLVSIQLANNETGVIQPVKELAEVVYQHGGFFHCDATQAVGKILLDFNALNVDMLSISAHKFGGVQGAAALIIKKGLHLQAHMLGGGQESSYRAGTENIAAIVAMGKALMLVTPQQVRGDTTQQLRNELESQLLTIAPNTIIFGKDAPRLPNTSCFAMPGMSSETQLINYDLAGIAVSSGSACSSGKVSTSHVLQAMGVDKELAGCAIRASLGWQTTQEDINAFLAVFKKNYEKTDYKEAA